MFNKKLKLEVKAIQDTVTNLMEDVKSTKDELASLMKTVKELKTDYADYLEWKKMRDANEETAAKLGHFYITADDSALLERLIQEVNKDPDLAVLLTTAQGTTLSLRSHPHPQIRESVINYKKYTENEK